MAVQRLAPERLALVGREVVVVEPEVRDHDVPPRIVLGDLGHVRGIGSGLCVHAAAQDLDAAPDPSLRGDGAREAGLGGQERVHCPEVVDSRRFRRQVEALEASLGIVIEAPRAGAGVGRPEPVVVAELLVVADDEQQRAGGSVPEAGVDEPLPAVRRPRGQPEVVRVEARRILLPPLDTRDVARRR